MGHTPVGGTYATRDMLEWTHRRWTRRRKWDMPLAVDHAARCQTRHWWTCRRQSDKPSADTLLWVDLSLAGGRGTNVDVSLVCGHVRSPAVCPLAGSGVRSGCSP